MKHYPSWRYHKDHEAKIVTTKVEDELLDEGWVMSPADFDVDEKPKGQSPPIPAKRGPKAKV